MNTEYVWWVVILLLVAGGAIAFLALGQVPEIEDEPAPETVEADLAESEPGAVEPEARARGSTAAAGSWRAPGQGAVVSSTVPGSDDPSVASETP
jgi:hypothetical protein